jgi:hypothetical protein
MIGADAKQFAATVTLTDSDVLAVAAEIDFDAMPHASIARIAVLDLISEPPLSAL